MKRNSITAFRLYLYLVGYVFGIMAFLRIVFWLWIREDLPAVLNADTMKAFYIGIRFDARIAALFTLPLGLMLCIPRLAESIRRWSRPLTLVYTPLFFVLLLVYFADFGFYAYLGNRVSKLLFELLADFSEAVDMVSQSYPIGLITLALGTATAALCYGFYRLLLVPVAVSGSKPRRVLGFVCGFVIFALAVYGQLNASLFPLRWSNAYFTTHEAVTALGLNPVQSLYDTYGASANAFDREQARKAYPAMAAYLGVDRPDPQTLNFERRVAAEDRAEAAGRRLPPNIVIIVMESLDYRKTSFAPGSGDPTPHLKALAAESMLFHRFFANARTTARAVFTLITGIPDVTQGSTGSRNSLVVDQSVVANSFKDYDKFYLIGGSASWANIRAVLARNIENLRLLEETDWRSPRVDVWGISDFDLFREAHQVFAAQDGSKPFLAVIQTASYHKPYTVPAVPGFSPARLSPEDAENYGFESEAEYNSMRFSDYSVAELFRLARTSDYYDNTIFFIFGDHGLNDRCRNMPAGYEAANLGPWHVPLIIHASERMGLVRPGESDALCSMVDIFPTAAGLAGVPYVNTTMGRDIFDPRFDGQRLVYISGKERTPIRILQDGYAYFNNTVGKEALFKINEQEGRDYSVDEPEVFRNLQRWARDMEATARYMLYNNKKEKSGVGR